MVGPTIIGPEEFANAGYDYVGFDVQHGYLDDADVALLLCRLEHVPVATAVRLPSTDPAPIGRVLDAGADAVIIAMVESAEQTQVDADLGLGHGPNSNLPWEMVATPLLVASNAYEFWSMP